MKRTWYIFLVTPFFITSFASITHSTKYDSQPVRFYESQRHKLRITDDYSNIPYVSKSDVEPPHNLPMNHPHFIRDEDTLVLDEGIEGHYYSSKYLAQKFSPGISCTLISVIVKILDTGFSCSLFVWADSSGIPQSSLNLIPPIYFTSSAPGWQRIDLTSPIFLNEDFWIGFYSNYPIYSDNNPNCHNRIAESNDKTYWYIWDYQRFGELLIRPIVTLNGPRHDVSCINLFSKRGYFLPNPAFDTVGIIIKNFGSITEFNVPVYLRVTDSLGMLVFFDEKYIDSLRHNEIDTIIFPWSYNHDCDCIIEGYPWLSDDCVRDNDRFELESYIRTYPCELYYDDVYTSFSGIFLDSIANKFIPPYYPCKIESVKFAFSAAYIGTMYTYGIAALILEDDSPGGYPGTEIAKDSVLGMGPGSFWWFSMDFSHHNVIIDTGGFFAVWTSIPDSTTPPYAPSIWIEDGNPPFALMTWYKYNGLWYHCLEFFLEWYMRADPMIRVCVDFPSAISEEDKRQTFSNYISIHPTISSGKFKCSFCAKKDGKLDISCYSVNGRRIKTLLKTYIKKGLHYIYPDLSNLPQGVYFILMKGDGFTDKKKIILIK